MWAAASLAVLAAASPLQPRPDGLHWMWLIGEGKAVGRGMERHDEKLIILHIYLFSGIIIKYVENFW